jgi:hypothetical protein
VHFLFAISLAPFPGAFFISVVPEKSISRLGTMLFSSSLDGVYPSSASAGYDKPRCFRFTFALHNTANCDRIKVYFY